VDDGGRGPLDRVVERLARAWTACGFNGTRLLWRWRNYRGRLAESGLRRAILWRSASTPHKMCRSCRALVPRGAGRCPDCGASLSSVAVPGVGRLLANLLPGLTAATSLLMLINGFWFLMMLLAQMRSGGGRLAGFDVELLVRFGAGLSRAGVLSGAEAIGGEWWRLITPIFLHAGLLHFVFNSFLLLQLGPLAEEVYGTRRFWVVYLACGIAGNAASQLPRVVITVGASGAIMGLIGLLLVHGYRSGSVLGQGMKQLAVRLLIYSLILNLFFRIDHINHAGGFAAGALAGLVVPPARAGSGDGRLWSMVSTAGVLLVLLAFWGVARQGALLAAP